MNKLIAPTIAIIAGLLSVPASAAEQGTVTREQIKAELAALQAAGYHASGEDPSYPVKLQAALMKIRESKTASMDESGYGIESMTMSESGHRSDPVK
ncbi:DUF4148 domain-containing protein [Burkholderia ubonensis]|uniref:DUF4148 domain-containing protein n=1 Tax=Burkholderia ubonensis TaxID=101571 RepID=UPI0007564301|nr:DUF4148 domain-containing protein [Burkholderia ubonensis]KVN45150.1 hypothetical protein WJ64_27110 [Burkholderia ubonensis]